MNKICVIIVFIFSLSLLYGCDSEKRVGSTKLIYDFLYAYDENDVEAFKELVYWGNANEEVRNLTIGRFESDLDMYISDISFDPLFDEQKPELDIEGVRYKMTLNPIGNLTVVYQGDEMWVMYYPVGVKDGVYYIIVTAPVS